MDLLLASDQRTAPLGRYIDVAAPIEQSWTHGVTTNHLWHGPNDQKQCSVRLVSQGYRTHCSSPNCHMTRSGRFHSITSKLIDGPTACHNSFLARHSAGRVKSSPNLAARQTGCYAFCPTRSYRDVARATSYQPASGVLPNCMPRDREVSLGFRSHVLATTSIYKIGPRSPRPGL